MLRGRTPIDLNPMQKSHRELSPPHLLTFGLICLEDKTVLGKDVPAHQGTQFYHRVCHCCAGGCCPVAIRDPLLPLSGLRLRSYLE